jgi:hypothetical protein
MNNGRPIPRVNEVVDSALFRQEQRGRHHIIDEG